MKLQSGIDRTSGQIRTLALARSISRRLPVCTDHFHSARPDFRWPVAGASGGGGEICATGRTMAAEGAYFAQRTTPSDATLEHGCVLLKRAAVDQRIVRDVMEFFCGAVEGARNFIQ